MLHYSLIREQRRERGYKTVWVCRTGNIETLSEVSADKAIQNHKRKLTTRELEEINKEERNVERFCFSY